MNPSQSRDKRCFETVTRVLSVAVTQARANIEVLLSSQRADDET
jgi:hypothetical protein